MLRTSFNSTYETVGRFRDSKLPHTHNADDSLSQLRWIVCRRVHSTALPRRFVFWQLTLLVVVGFFLESGTIYAATCTATTAATQPRNWSAVGTWSCGNVPANNDSVVIPNGATVTLDVNTNSIGDLNINSGGVLQGNNTNKILSINNGTGVDSTNSGQIQFGAGKLATIKAIQNIQWTGTGIWNLSTIDLNNHTVTFSAGSTLTINMSGVAAPIINAGTLTSLSTVSWNFSGVVAQTLPTSTNIRFGDVTVSNTAGVTLGVGLTSTNLLGNLTIAANGILNNGGFGVTLASGKSFAVDAGAQFNLTGTSTMVAVSGGGTKTFNAASIVNYTGTNQTVSADSYGYLTFGGSGTKTAAGAFTVAKDLNIGGVIFAGATTVQTVNGNITNTGTHTATSGSITLSGGSASHILSGAGTYANLILNDVNGASLNASSTISGTLTLTSGVLSVGGNTLALNGPAISGTSAATNLSTTSSSSLTFGGSSASVTIPGSVTALNNLTINNSSGIGLGGSSVTTTLSGTLTLTSGTFAVGANTLVLNGPAIAGTSANLSTTSSSNLSFGGSSTGVTLPSSVTALNNLTINNTNGISLGGSSVVTTLSGTLALNANNLSTGTNTLILAGDCTANSGDGSLTRTSGYVIGNLKLTFPAGSSTCTYHVGDSIGYSPITVVIAVTGAGTLSGRVDASDHPDTASAASGIDATKSANHYWTITGGTLTTTGYSAAFRFCANSGSCTATEVDSEANTGNFIVVMKTSGSWSTKTVGTKNAYSTQATGITGFGEFAVGELSTNNCYNDNFTGTNGSAPGTNWSVGYKTGTFGNPVIYGNRLRLTNASSSAATWATLQRLFPAAGNKITVEFDLFAYGGTDDADGIALVLSDALVAPVAGAFGGSLGYAQKSNPGSDCSTTGGCPGFAGGWLGVALDEYGNFSTNTEGRFGGYTEKIPNSVAVRGSGSGMSGYRFLQGTSTLSPAIDGNGSAIPPHRYRIIVDHTDGNHAWASVERDTSGGGTAYATLIGCPPGITSGCTAFDVKDPGYSQNALPVYWNLSFTGSTGVSNNIHEIDSLKVCTVQRLASPVLHHIKIEHGGTACTSNASMVTVKACANTACDALYMGSVTTSISATNGGSWSPTSPITFSGGQTTVTLTDSSASADILDATATSPTASNATQCFNGTTETCTLTFATCVFDVIETGAAVNTPIYTKLANIGFDLKVLSLSSSSQTASKVELVDASSGTCGTYTALQSSSTSVPSTFSANTSKNFSFTYNNAAPNVRVRVNSGSLLAPFYSCSSDNFAIRPQTFALASSATQTGSSGTPIFRAGTDTFSLSATALYSATTTTNYIGTPKLNLTSGMITTALAHLGVLSSTTFAAASSGVASASGLTYSEVGNFSLAQYAVYDDTFAQVDSVKGECASAFSNTLSNSRYSCQFGSAAAGAFGRFVPDHFTVSATVANACPAGTFAYMGQPFALSTANVVQAENAANGVAQNYTGAYAHGTISFGAENDDNGTDLSARLTFANNGGWASGIYTLTSVNGTFTRPASAVSGATWGSFESLDIGLTVVANEGDLTKSANVKDGNMSPGAVGGSSFAYKKLSASPLRMRFGRIGLQNAYGSELLDLAMPLTAEYWDGSSWVANAADQCSTGITLPVPTDPIATDGLVPAELCAWDTGAAGSSGLGCAAAGTIANRFAQPPLAGNFNLNFRAPGIGNTGALDITATVPVWMRFNWDGVDQGGDGNLFDDNPTARATFGIYKGNSRFIYIRELY